MHQKYDSAGEKASHASTGNINRGSISSCALSIKIDICFQVTQTVAFFHSCLNPVLYVFVGERFRRDLVKTLKNLGCISQAQWVSFTRREGSLKLSSMLLETTSGALSF